MDTALRTDTGDMAPGFADPPIACAETFRAILAALSRPGRIADLPVPVAAPGAMLPGAAAIALTLVDHDTPVWLDTALRCRAVSSFLAFHCGCPIVADPGAAAFAFVAEPQALETLGAFAAGSPEYPDRSATVVLQVPDLRSAGDVRLTGPGIETAHTLDLGGGDAHLWRLIARNNRRYPLGVDVLFASAGQIAGCPRSTLVTESEVR